MATLSCQELARKKDELATRLGPRIRPDGFTEFCQFVEKACALEAIDQAESQRLLARAEQMRPQVEKSVETALSLRDQIKAKMLEYAEEGMNQYNEALKELAK